MGYNSTGALLAQVKDLPTGERLTFPTKSAVDPAGNFLIVDTGLNKTLLFDPDLKYLGHLPEIGTPNAMDFYNGELYTLFSNDEEENPEHKVIVYSYKYQ